MIDDMQAFIRQKVREHLPATNEKIMWSLHAVQKLRAEHLGKDQVEARLLTCDIIEYYSMENRPLPGCLVLGFGEQQPIHVVIAVDIQFDRIFIVTIYKPLIARWENDWKTRK